jgi:hypothetical protein
LPPWKNFLAAAAVPFFGFREAKGGGALVGKFYDLKQLKDGKPSKLDQDHGYSDELYNFVTKSAWNTSVLEKYFVGPNPLFTTQIYIPKINADQGPLAFGLGGRVQPKMWVVHYKGNVVPTESGTFRFVGMADDVLVVRFNGKVVLDRGSNNPSGHGPQQFYATLDCNSILARWGGTKASAGAIRCRLLGAKVIRWKFCSANGRAAISKPGS